MIIICSSTQVRIYYSIQNKTTKRPIKEASKLRVTSSGYIICLCRLFAPRPETYDNTVFYLASSWNSAVFLYVVTLFF